MSQMKLFDRIKIGNITLRNRIAMAPMGCKTDPDGGFDDRSIEYFGLRAKGGTGLIITGLNMVCTEYETRAANVLEGFHHVNRLSLLVDKCHQYGAKVLVQIGPGLGRVGYSDPENPPYSASAVPCKNFPDLMCKPFEKEQIEHLVKCMGRGAMLAKNAGADGVEIHAYGGYIFDQFMTPIWNKRTDEYGGDLKGRMKFLLDSIEEVKKVCGSNFLCVVKFTADHCLPEVEGMRTLDEGIEIAKILDSIGGIDAIHVDTGCYERYNLQVSTVYEKPGFQMYAAKAVKDVVHVPVIGHGKLNDPAVAEKAVEDGCIDIVALGHQMLADPEWVHKVQEGRIADIKFCCGCNECLLGAVRGRFKPCAMNPISGNEIDYPQIPVNGDKKMLVVGGGPGGMAAAIEAAGKGIHVELWEKEEVLGGNLRAAGAPSFKHDVAKALSYLEHALYTSGTMVRLNKPADAQEIIDGNYDYVVIATGSRPFIPPISGVNNPIVVTANDALTGPAMKGKVVVIGGGLVGCEAAVHASQSADQVAIVEMLDDILVTADHLFNNDQALRRLVADSNIEVHCSSKVTAISDDGVTFEQNGKTEFLSADHIIVASGFRPNNELEDLLWGKVKDLRMIGDAVAPRKIITAVSEGYHYARLAN